VPRSSRGAYVVVLAGLAGAGKTDMLHALAAAGEQVLDLEALACHRGSAFGGLGMPAQPSHAAFAREVARRWNAAAPGRPLWVEDEGPFLGAVGVPPWLQDAIGRAPVVALETPVAERRRRLTATYRDVDVDSLLAALARSRRRLGAERAEGAAGLVRGGDVAAAVALVLPRFDAAYRHRMAAHGRRTLLRVEPPVDAAALARAVAGLAGAPRP
jgi:tRNA 2-selenouridine synthase